MNRARFMSSMTRWTLLPAIAIAAAGGVGCASPPRAPDAIPASAEVLSNGQNELISATPTVAGTAYIYDASTNRVVYSGALQGGDKIVVDPGAGLITVNAVTVSEQNLSEDHLYMIKFDHP